MAQLAPDRSLEKYLAYTLDNTGGGSREQGDKKNLPAQAVLDGERSYLIGEELSLLV